MNRNNFWRLALVVLVIVWSLYELYPPKGRDLVVMFRDRAVNRDAAFKTILDQAQTLERTMPDRPYDDLKEAIGTNDITHYFPFFNAKDELHPTTYVLNRLQREAAGKIRLGLDLQGGTSFLMKMDTNGLTQASDTSAALSQAVEVLRRRVDRFGVAEPLIQPQGSDRILVQLPGLSAADQESAKIQIQRAARAYERVGNQSQLIDPRADDAAFEFERGMLADRSGLGNFQHKHYSLGHFRNP